MKSRRLIASPVAQGKTSYQVKLARWKGTPNPPDVRKGSKGEILAPSICFPLYPQHRTSPSGSIRRRTYSTGDIPFAELKLVLIHPTTKQLVPKPQPVCVDDV
jgi:hypothetical protein